MSNTSTPPAWRWSTLILAMLSLSIGWGIRGNFGHEFGAMLAGTLCGTAVALFSGREDWRRRVLYFAFFGALGWGFGGSMSYMQVVSYTHSGHWVSQLYGFYGTFALGFLWSAMGGAGTAYPAVEDRERLTALMKPLIWVFVVWALYYFFEDPLEKWYTATFYGEKGVDQRWFRQKSPFYWLDTDWLQAFLALIALCAFDQWQRRANPAGWLMLTVFAVCGAALGFVVQWELTTAGAMNSILAAVVQPQGDITQFDRDNLITNWPQFFSDIGSHLGWIFGVIFGVGLYFFIFGKWSSGSALLMHMALGWYIAFLAMPVFGSLFLSDYGGFRMTPPRGDNWAGLVGVLAGTMIYMSRNGLIAVNYATLVSGFVGGLGLAGTQFLKLMLTSFGNPVLVEDPAVQEAWKHWQGANWHSLVIEQGVGLVYGLGIALAMAWLSTRLKPLTDEPPVRRWTEAFCVFFLLNVLVYVNVVKAVTADWTSTDGRPLGFRSVPETMKMPLFQYVEMSAWAWYSLLFACLSICTVLLLEEHLRRPLSVVPKSWLGKGQMFYLIFLWAIVIGNFQKALVSFTEQRIGTEGTVFFNAIVATYIILYYGRERETVPLQPISRFGPAIAKLVPAGFVAVLVACLSFYAGTRAVYGDKFSGFGGENRRFGPQADWLVKPVLKNAEHR
ncbi:MAG: hypothetical protein HY706_20015 [Candidatus Hydrogenedentes bacterium]|nr:hypothetical protein [Candidatus Hydrogenedentota bacterium]